jgi:Asp-tRNA(Asn)/Glu-tRNA(Gln) amidotransferase A subunit family amidase
VERIAWESEAVAAGYGVVRRASMASFPATRSYSRRACKLVERDAPCPRSTTSAPSRSATNAAFRVVVKPLLADFDFLLTPTLGLVPMPIEAVPPFLSEPYGRYHQFVLPVSFAHTPAVAFPPACEGLPVGVRLVARRAANGSCWPREQPERCRLWLPAPA